MVRIVALADTHLFNHSGYDIPDGDILVHAGDMCRSGDFRELQEASEWINSLPHPNKVVIAGNHDWAFVRRPEQAQLLFSTVNYLQDSEATVAGIRFYGAPWQPEFLGWAFNLPRGEPMAEVWGKIPTGIDVLVTHGPPLGFGDRTYADERVGCADLIARIRVVKPRVHLFGHIHQDGGNWLEHATTFLNVTTNECRRSPTVFDIDPKTKRVVLVSVPKRRWVQ